MLLSSNSNAEGAFQGEGFIVKIKWSTKTVVRFHTSAQAVDVSEEECATLKTGVPVHNKRAESYKDVCSKVAGFN